MAYDLFTVIAKWQELGVFGVLLPFLLVFALTFAILQKTKILGADHRNLNIIVSVVLGLLFLQNVYLVELVQLFLPKIGMAMLFFLMFMLLVGVFMGDKVWGEGNGWKTAAIILAAIGLLWASFSDYADTGVLWWLEDFLASIGLSIQSLVFLIVIIVALYLMTREGGHGGKPKT